MTQINDKMDQAIINDDYNQIADAIRNLVVRGAPAIGVSGAFGLGLAAWGISGLISNKKYVNPVKIVDNLNRK